MSVVLYSTNCPKCKVLEAKLNEAKIKHDIIEDPDLMMAKGFMESPMLEEDGFVMNFIEAVKWINTKGGNDK